MSDFLSDIRYALRGLIQQPRFAVIAIVTVALGVGLNTVIFSVVNAVLLRPLPYPDAGRVVRVHNTWEGTPVAGLSPAEYFDYEAGVADVFASFGAYAFGALSLSGDGEPARLRAAFATDELLPALGAAPAVGRPYTRAEDRDNAPVMLIGHGLWRGRFGADSTVVGRAIVLNGRAWTVIGVLPAGFHLPEDYLAGQATEIVAPLGIDPSAVGARGSHFLSGIGRLADGVSRERARATLETIAAGFVADFPGDYPRDMAFHVGVQSIGEQVVGGARQGLVLLLGAAAFVLLVACATVANLLLVRLDGRRRELAIRAALGARRTRVLRQLLAESLTLAGLGAALGLAFAWWAGGVFVSLRPPGLPRVAEVGVDGWVIAFAVGAALFMGTLFGLVPALAGSDLRIGAVLRAEGGGTVASGREWPRRALVVGQVALAVMLLAGAGLLGRTLVALRAVDPGFEIRSVLTGRFSLPSAAYPDESQVIEFFRVLEDRINGTPGVLAAGAVTNLPLATSLGDLNFRIEGRPVPDGEVSPRADWQVVTPGYFAAMGLRLRRGRFLDARDTRDAPGAVVINRTMADRLWPSEEALGRRFVLGGRAGPGTVTIVGIVDDVRHASLADRPVNQMYLAHAQFRFWNGGSVVRAMTLAVRTRGDATAMAGAVRAAVRDLDPRIPLSGVQTMSDVWATSLGRERLLFALAGAFAVLALVLGSLGIYGVVAHGVARRTREIGVRVALGARAVEVTALVVRQGAALVAIGLAIGLAGAAALTGLLRGMLYGVAPLDPVTLGGATALLGGVALLACYVPARRAMRIDPMEALRHE